MECNKEEALRAKSIAESKMQNKDFAGARKIVLKAQQLFPDLDNISQMLTVCEVHCAAGTKVNGEIDWYGILQVEPTADEGTIRRQYLKLALLLHPDKNKYGGAEAAFKLIGEAHRLLSDKGKRSLHDIQRGASFRTVSMRHPPQPSKEASYTKKQPFSTVNQQPPPPASTGQTFWTICPHCGIRYQYYQSIMNRALRCQSCMKPFIAYDLNAQAMPSAAPWNRSGVPQQGNPGTSAHNAGQKGYFGTTSGMRFQGPSGGPTVSEPWSRSGLNTDLGSGFKDKVKEDGKVDGDTGTNEVKFEKVKLQEVNKREQAAKPSTGSGRQKRRKKTVVESSDTESSDSDVVIEDGHFAGQNGVTASRYPRRSARQKQNVSYSEVQSDDDDFVSPKFKRLKKGGASFSAEKSDEKSFGGEADFVNVQGSENAAPMDKKDSNTKVGCPSESLPNGLHERYHKEGQSKVTLDAGACSKPNASIDLSSEASPDLDSFSYPDPEFCDFEKERDGRKFAAEQIWAVYDNLDGMPRFYARIRQVYGPEFKLRFNWLEYVPTNKAEEMWSEGEFPTGCGNFKLGKSENTQDRLMFSHLMPWSKGTKRSPYAIHPRKGEVWALFKDWSIEWGLCADSGKHYEYEVVEVLSDFTEDDAISVLRLVKVKGFVSLFMQATDEGTIPVKIPSGDMLRFSHKIPSYRMTGDEREGVLRGSFELDCASLPTNFMEMFQTVSPRSTTVRVENVDVACNGLNSKSVGTTEVPTYTTNKTSIDLEEIQRSRDVSSHRENVAWKNELNHSSRPQHAAESGRHVESEPVTTKQQSGGSEDNAGSQDPDTDNALLRRTASHPSSASPNSYEYPDSDFYNFEEGRSFEKLERGQVWALYSEIDSYPKYYGRIKKVESEKLKVHVTWLEGYSEQEGETRWFDGQLPAGCGTFKIIKETGVFDTMDTFSHMVQAKPMGQKDHYVIYPSVGQIWAVYKNWRVDWSLSDLETCEFDLVEILSCSESGFKVLVLKKLDGYRSVFMPERRVDAEMEIRFDERLRFSHQIPSYRLTEERGGKLRGYWELDPASVPDVFLFTDSS